MIKIAVLASGNGSNAEAIIKYFQNNPNVDVECFSDKSNARALQRAENLGSKATYVPFEDNFKYFSENPFDLYALAGYMRILPEKVLNLGTFVNIHPSLLPSFKGKNAISKAYNYGAKVTGVTIHYAEKQVDSGQIILQTPVTIEENMNLAELTAKIHEIEHRIYPRVLESLIYDKIVDFSETQNDCGQGGCGNGGCGKCRH